MGKKDRGDQSKVASAKKVEEALPLFTSAGEEPQQQEEPAAIEAPKEMPGKDELPPQAVKPEPPPTLVKLDVFCQLTGMKFDHLAGFRYVAKKKKLGPLSVTEWWAAFNEYQKRPVG